MFTLIIGGSASGKSVYAESLFSPGQHNFYIATMEPFDAECRERITKHQAQRAGRGFETIERYRDLAGLDLPQRGDVLLEDMGNLTANELYSPQGAGDRAVQAILAGVDSLLGQCQNLVVVSNEVFLGGKDYEGDTLRYLEVLAEINRGLAARADCAVEMAAGLPIFHKGGPEL